MKVLIYGQIYFLDKVSLSFESKVNLKTSVYKPTNQLPEVKSKK